MKSINRVTLLGNLGVDPEVRHTKGGDPVANFSMATSHRWTHDGKEQIKTVWHNIVVWGARGEACGKYLKKGSRVLIEGRLNPNIYEKDGIKRSKTEIVAENVVFLDTRQQETIDEVKSSRSGKPDMPDFDKNDDVPF